MWFKKNKGFGRESFSQCGEDMIIDFIFNCMESDKQTGKYIDIGAHHPSYLNNTLVFYKKGWTGINVDPLKENIQLFKKERPRDRNLNLGIGVETREMDFYRMDAETLSTFNKNVAEDNEKMGHKIVATERIKFWSVEKFITENKLTNDVDILSIDIEGEMYGIIKKFLENDIRPKIIIAETAFYSPDLRKAKKDNGLIENIVSSGYVLYADTFVNSIFISKEFYKR